jgi:hypothetical protein
MNLSPDVMFWLTIIGTVTGIAGLYFAIISWREAKSAKIAATDATNQVRGIHDLVDTSRLQMRCYDVQQFLDLKEYQLVRQNIREILRGVNKLKVYPSTKGHLDQDTWKQITADLINIEDSLQDLKDGQKFDGIRICEQRIVAIDESLSLIASKCQFAAEELK